MIYNQNSQNDIQSKAAKMKYNQNSQNDIQSKQPKSKGGIPTDCGYFCVNNKFIYCIHLVTGPIFNIVHSF